MEFTKRRALETRPDPLQIAIEPAIEGTMISIVGELDLATAPQLLEALDSCRGPLIYDLAGVTFFDSSGLLALLTRDHNQVRIVNPSRCVERVIHILKLDRLISSDLGRREAGTQRRVKANEPVGQGDWAVITLEGEIDLARADALDAILAQQWNPTQNLLIDLVAVTFIDLIGLRWLLNTRATVVESGRELRLMIPEGGHLERLLELTGLTSSFTIYRNLDKALERVSSGENVQGTADPKRDLFAPDG